MRKIILIFFLFPVFQISAQSRYGTSKTYVNNRNTIEQFREDKERDGGFISNKNLVYKEIQGTPYLNEQFSEGVISLVDGTVLDSCLLRYNIFTDQIEYRFEGVVYEVAPKSKVKRANFDNREFAFVKFMEKGKQTEQFMEVLADGKVSLYKKYLLKFNPPASSSPYQEAQQASFELPLKTFYLTDHSRETVLINNRKSLLKMMEKNRTEVNSYISQNGLSPLKEEDLLKIVVYFNSL